MSTIVLTNENALRVENDDRRTVFLDVSPARKEDLQYFKKLGNAIKYPEVREAFYSYLRAIAEAYPDFDGNPPPMTESKQEHIMSTLQPLFQFIKDRYVVAENLIYKLPVQQFYERYTDYCNARHISPLSKINVARTLSNELGITSKLICKDKKPTRILNISREDLYKKYFTKNWIHETDEIDIEGIEIPKKPALDPKALNQFLAQFQPPSGKQEVKAESSKTEKKDLTKKKDLTEKKETPEGKPSVQTSPVKKAPPPVPPKPNRLKVKVIPAEPTKDDQCSVRKYITIKI
jgi:hypothetical protein